MFRDALMAAGRVLFAPLLQHHIDRIDRDHQASPSHRRIGRRPATLATLFGEVPVVRDYYLAEGKAEEGGHCPADAAMGLEVFTTAALARLVTRAAAQQPYGAASRDLAEYGAIHVDERQIQRLVTRLAPAVDPWLAGLPHASLPLPVMYVSCDGTGTPMRAKELEGRKGKQADGTSKTREVKLGAVFTQHRTDPEGFPVRDLDSTTYVASYETSAEFSLRLREEARRRGLGVAEKVVFISTRNGVTSTVLTFWVARMVGAPAPQSPDRMTPCRRPGASGRVYGTPSLAEASMLGGEVPASHQPPGRAGVGIPGATGGPTAGPDRKQFRARRTRDPARARLTHGHPNTCQ